MKDMETIEEIYAGMLEEHELVLAARRQEHIKAANPYGCNQYGHRKGHGGGSSGEISKKKEQTKEEKKPETQKEEEHKHKKENGELIKKKLHKLDWELYDIEVEIDNYMRAFRRAKNNSDEREIKTIENRLNDLATSRDELLDEIERLKKNI